MASRRRRAAAVVSGLVVTTCLLPQGVASADTDPGAKDWERVPRDQVAAECGMDPELLEATTVPQINTPFVVIRYGKLCWEGGYPSGTTEPYRVFSVTKTMGALLTGMVASRSELDDTDPVTDWIAPEDMGRINPEAKIAHVLAMAATNEDLSYGGKKRWTYDVDGSREINTLVGAMERAIAQEPERFAGSDSPADVAAKELFAPLGMQDSSWPGGQIGGNMISSVRDMAKMGELLLQRGRYDGRQLIDEEYVYRMTHPSFEDSNTGFGYLTYANALENEVYSTGTADDDCAPYTRWPQYPHAPFFEAPDANGGFPGEQQHDIGVVWAAGAGGQKMAVHRGLDLVIAARDDSVSVGESEPVGFFEGHKNVWKAIRPALVAMDPVYQGDEAGFCAAYKASTYAPDLLEPWFQPASTRGAAAPGAAPVAGAAPAVAAPAAAAPAAAAPAGAAPGSTRALAATGADSLPLAVGALGVLLGLTVHRRRRSG
jgi:CubicO group peptidase (beta-lactamase class C family)